MSYISTRGSASPKSLNQLLTQGTAEDGGLYVPVDWPDLSSKELEQISSLPYPEIAARILDLFGGESWKKVGYGAAIINSLKTFEHPLGPPLLQLDEKLWSLELFHGPSFAFKDYALIPLAALIDLSLKTNQDQATILCATSGDTGAATAFAFSKYPSTKAVVLFPEGRVSDIQRKQMTTLGAENVLALSVIGNFDDCQNIVKKLFQSKLAQKHKFAAANSINFVRILLQSAYYIYAASTVAGRASNPVNFVVPTGNFGNVFSAYIAKKLGAPIGKLVVSSNENDVLPHLFDTGKMLANQTKRTISPSMDIQVSSNFERMLWLLTNSDQARTALLQQQLEETGVYQLTEQEMHRLSAELAAIRCDTEQALGTMRDILQKYDKTICPHTATAYLAVNNASAKLSGTTIVVETAHAAKFPDATRMAFDKAITVPRRLQEATGKQEVFTTIEARAELIAEIIEQWIGGL